jgi:Holliday junction resolvase RusA-like endonuclease
MNAPICFTILGQPQSKANSRHLAFVGPEENRRMLHIKSDAALKFERDALKQIPVRARQRLEGPVRVTLRIFYASERPDLDESLVLDVLQDQWGRTKPKNAIVPPQRLLLQDGVYRNDRQVREKHVYHGVDRVNPRVEIEVEALAPQQVGLKLRDCDDLAAEIFG